MVIVFVSKTSVSILVCRKTTEPFSFQCIPFITHHRNNTHLPKVLALLGHVIPIGNALVTPFKGHPDMVRCMINSPCLYVCVFLGVPDCISQSQELVVVMILSPYLLNSVFFWVMDNLLMASSTKNGENMTPPKRRMPSSAASESYPFIQHMCVSVVNCMCVDHVREICVRIYYCKFATVAEFSNALLFCSNSLTWIICL